MSKFAIRVSELTKEYVIGGNDYVRPTLRDVIASKLTRPWTWDSGKTKEPKSFKALKDVSFDVEQGDVLGVIGRNGAGKSTLLKVLARITTPTSGRAEIRGRIASLLEVGTGFHPELSGRENIYLNGAILGMTRAEITRKFDEIVDFSGVEKFLDTPVKRYSSGMYVRLAFAVAAHLEPEILIVDEVLAVGDVEFQRKCLGRMNDVANSGRTVLLVSHNLGNIRTLCSKALVLDEGRIVASGDVDAAMKAYEDSIQETDVILSSHLFRGPLLEVLKFEAIQVRQNGSIVAPLDAFQPFKVVVSWRAIRPLKGLDIDIGFWRDGLNIARCHDVRERTDCIDGIFESHFEFDAGIFNPGRFYLSLGASISNGQYAWGGDIAHIVLEDASSDLPSYRKNGIANVRYGFDRKQSSDG